MKKQAPQPVREIDLSVISVFSLIHMLERGERDAFYIMMSLEAAKQRGIEKIRDGSVLK